MKCCVPGCTSANVIKGGVKFRQYSFFRFPVEPKQQKEWREILRVKDVPGVSQKICEKHFNAKYLEDLPGNKKRLDWRAVPRVMEEVGFGVQKVEKPKRKSAEAKSEFYKVLEEYKRAKEKYFSLLGIPKDFEDDFDDAEYFGIHYEGLPWWARPRLCLTKDDADEEPEDVMQKKLCEICGKLEVNYDLHMLLFHPPEIKIDIDIDMTEVQDQDHMEFEVIEHDGGESVDTQSVGEPEALPEEELTPKKEEESPKQKYMCSCYKIVSSIEALVDHITKAQGQKSNPSQTHNLECINCQSQFKDLGLFKRHVDANGTLCFKSTHLVAPLSAPLGKRLSRFKSPRKGDSSTNTKTKECEVCGIVFYYGQAFMEHQRTVHGLDSADELVNYLMEPDLNDLDDMYTKEILDEEAMTAKKKYFRDMDIPREFMSDFDDPENFGRHEGLPWWATPIKVEEPEKKVLVRRTTKRKVKTDSPDKDTEDPPEEEAEESVTFRYASRDRKDLCEYCGFIRAHIMQHIHMKHMMEDKPCNDCGRKVSLTKKHVCDGYPRRKSKCLCTCGEGFILVETLHAHVTVENAKGREIHRFQCMRCKEVYDDKTDFAIHVQSHDSKYQCDICSKYFKNAGNLRQHKLLHTAATGEEFECEVCGQKFKKKRYCNNHMEWVHRAVPVPCPHCDGMFKPGRFLNNHIRRQHLQKRDFVCEVCQKTFNQLSALKYHLTIHTGERPHPCPFCHQTFKIKKDLRRHFANHKDLTIKCPMCKNYFLNEEDLKYHCNRYHPTDSSVREEIMQFDIVAEEYEIA